LELSKLLCSWSKAFPRPLIAETIRRVIEMDYQQNFLKTNTTGFSTVPNEEMFDAVRALLNWFLKRIMGIKFSSEGNYN
jgi:hypothetical protein